MDRLQPPAHINSARVARASSGERALAVIFLAAFTGIVALIAVGIGSLALTIVNVLWVCLAWITLGVALWPGKAGS